MEERKLRAVLAQSKSVRERAILLINKAQSLDTSHIRAISDGWNESSDFVRSIEEQIKKVHTQIESLVNSHNYNIYENSKTTGIKLTNIPVRGMESSLHQLIIECDTVMGALEEDITNLSSGDMDNLGKLKKECSKICEKLDINFEKNLNESLMEMEKGHFLASTLITSRIIDCTLSKIKGKSDEDKINSLIEEGVIEHDTSKIRQQIIKVSKKSRNYLNHRIDTFAEPSDALSLFGDCLFLLKTVEKM